MSRKDEDGNECPSTLGEYRDLCDAIVDDECAAVKLLDKYIEKYGREKEVVASDLQMRSILLSLLFATSTPEVDLEKPL